MKKKVLAALLAVCMILSTCVLYASAKDYKTGNTLVGATSATLKIGTKGSDYEIPVTVTVQSNPSLATGTTQLSAEQIDKVFTFRKTGTSTTYKYASALSQYLTIDAVADDSAKTVTIKKVETTKFLKKCDVTADFTDKDTVEHNSETMSPLEDVPMYEIDVASAPKATGVKFTNNLCTLTMGVRFFGKTYDNLVASEIAKVTATVKRENMDSVISVSNKIEDLMIGDIVELVPSLKDPSEKDYYEFRCWVDGSGNVITTDGNVTVDKDSNKLTVKINGNSAAYYAAFVEKKNRFTISYSATGSGKLVYAEGREVFPGDAQISVLEGRNATFTFVPDEGYEVAHVYIDKGTEYAKDVASFIYLVDSTDLLASLKELIAATDKDNYTYTFENVIGDHTIEVVYQKVKVLEEPSGKDLPTVAAEGITLATGADAENGDGENGGATTVPAEDGAAANGGSAASGVVNPATGSTGAIAVFATLSVAACAAFVTAKKKED